MKSHAKMLLIKIFDVVNSKRKMEKEREKKARDSTQKHSDSNTTLNCSEWTIEKASHILAGGIIGMSFSTNSIGLI